jgi:uncharacterized membrane protein
MRRFSTALLVGYWALCFVLYPRLPGRIAIHFDARGQADGWTDRPWLAWFGMPLLATATALLIIGCAKLARQNPHLWNIPEKKRFLALTPEQREPILVELDKMLDLVTVYTVAVFLIVQVEIYTSAIATARLFYAVRVNRRVAASLRSMNQGSP